MLTQGDDDDAGSDGDAPVTFRNMSPAKPKPPRKPRKSKDWRLAARFALSDPILLKRIEGTLTTLRQDNYEFTNGRTYSPKTGLSSKVEEKKCRCKKCEFQVRILTVMYGTGDGDGHVLVESAGAHNHVVDIADMSAHLSPFITQHLEMFIGQTQHTTALQVWQHLREKGVDTVNLFKATKERKEKVLRYIRNEKTKRRPKVEAHTVGGLLTLCTEGELDLELHNIHDPCILGGHFVDKNSKELAITWSTRHLLANAAKLDNATLMFDGTYRIIFQDFVLIIYGVKDDRNCMHVVAVTMVNSENNRCMDASLSSVLDAVTLVSGKNAKTLLTSSMIDNSTPSFNAIGKNMTLTGLPGVCYFHLQQAINKHAFKKQKHREPFKRDVSKVANATIPGIHDEMLDLLRDKWKELEPDVADWFFDYWANICRQTLLV